MKNNKKGVSPLIASVIIIVFTIIFFGLVATWVNQPQNYCERNPQDCECLEEDTIFVEKLMNREGKYFDELKGYDCELDERDYNFICKRCLNYQKKNTCQLFLEKKGWLDTDCVCSEWREKIKCLEWEKRENVNDTYYRNYGIPCIKKVQDNPDCIKAREKTECEKGNPEYIYDQCLKLETVSEDGIPITLEVSDKENTALSSITLNKQLNWKYIGGIDCRKKTFEDLTCLELEKEYDCVGHIICKNNYKSIFGYFYTSYDETDILKRMLELGCFK